MGLTKRLAKHNVKRPRMVRREAKRQDVPLQNTLALLELETGIPQRNIFGCDHGVGHVLCHLKVTRERVKWLLASGLAQGIGWTQLTYPPIVAMAEKLGRVDKPRWQLRVGLKVLRDNYETFGSWQLAHQAYNGSGSAAVAYGYRAIDAAAGWHRVVYDDRR